jgi:two-component system sensor histidine kinase ChvG
MESFAADLSHELKNPLASIRVATEILSDDQEPADRRRFLEVIQAEVARMENLVSGVREVTFVEANIEREERGPLLLNRFLKEFLEGLELRLGGRVALKFEGFEVPVYAEASPERLTQVMENLIENAVSFSQEGAPVIVRLLQEQEWAVISVRDFGPGIPAEHQGRIFDRFFSHRAGEHGSKSQHIGLGLAIVKAVVEGYGGRLSVRNASDQGSIFEFRLRSTPQGKVVTPSNSDS